MTVADPLLRFYRLEGTDARGRTLSEIWSWDADRLEGVHDYIQWLFPLPEASAFNPSAPLLTDATLEAFRADPQGFDAVITDERMPGMTGSSLIRELRGLRPQVPTLLMSGFIAGTVSSKIRDSGADEVLKKPLSGRELAASLARVLHRARVGGR